MDPTKPDDLLNSDVLSTRAFVRPSRIMIIDADATSSKALVQVLEKENHSVTLAKTGRDGLKLAEEENPDLFLVDVHLGDIDGFEVCRRIKAHATLQYSPVALITALNSTESHVRGLESGANDFLLKPFDSAILTARVTSLLKYRAAVAALRQTRVELENRVRQRTAELLTANEKLANEVKERKKAEAALRVSEERYALAAHGANDGLWDWNLLNNELYFAPRWKSMLGFKDSEIGIAPDEWLKRIHPDDMPQFKTDLDAHLQAITQHLRTEFRIYHKDGTIRWVLCRGMAVRRAEDGKPYRIAGSMSDITTRKVMELQLRHDAFHDSLTGLPNRPLFTDRLGQAIERMKRHENTVFVVLFLDLDRFKIINDSLGHSTGDHLLIEFGRRIKKCLRPADTVARLGGDEFAVLLEEVRNMDDAHRVANRIHSEMKVPFKLASREVFVTTSIGMAMGKRKYERPDEVLRDADTALYQAKAAGIARQQAFHSGMHTQVVTLLDLEYDLRQAVELQQFLIYYQPIIALKTGKIAGFEALIRWKHATRGMVMPGEFVSLSEETELITPMTWWVMKEACQQLRTWQQKYADAANMYVSVNLSGATFTIPDLHKRIGDILEETKFPSTSLKLEITEGVLMQHAQITSATIAKLKEMNVELLIDDFGTGYSSLSYLHRWPIDVLKIDRSFVASIGVDDKNSEIVRTICTLADNLQMKVVAEGVENTTQLEYFKNVKCDFVQGYHFARPGSAEDIEKLLAEKKQW